MNNQIKSLPDRFQGAEVVEQHEIEDALNIGLMLFAYCIPFLVIALMLVANDFMGLRVVAYVIVSLGEVIIEGIFL